MPYDLNHQNSTIKRSSVPAASLAQQPASLPPSPRTRGPDTGFQSMREGGWGSVGVEARENEIHWLLTVAVTSNYLLLRSGSHPTESFWLWPPATRSSLWLGAVGSDTSGSSVDKAAVVPCCWLLIQGRRRGEKNPGKSPVFFFVFSFCLTLPECEFMSGWCDQLVFCFFLFFSKCGFEKVQSQGIWNCCGLWIWAKRQGEKIWVMNSE